MTKAKTQSIQKGKVFVQTSKGVYPYSVLEQAEIKKSSSQLKQSDKWLTENDLVPPPYTPESLLTLYESNPIFARCVGQLATDVAGLGWCLQLKEGAKENDAEHKRMNAFLTKPNPDEALRNIVRPLLIDWGSIGWFGLEVVRNNKAEVAEIYHVPAHTLRVHKSNEKYCQRRNNKKVWFKKFGTKKDISAKDGKEKSVTSRTKANELIFYRNFYPRSDYYGVTNAISAVGDIVGAIGLRDYNLSFFENYGVPSAIVVLEGEWDDSAETTVSSFINKEFTGTDRQHRTLVVTQPDKCKFTYTPIGAKDTKEGSFRLYEQGRRDNILIAYSMPPERIGIRVTGSLGGNVAAEATKIYVQGVVEPLQLDLEDIINNLLLPSEIYQFKFTNIDTRNVDELVKRLNSEIEHSIRTPNEARNALGLPPYSEGDKFYIASNLVEAGEPSEPLSKIEQEFLDNDNNR